MHWDKPPTRQQLLARVSKLNAHESNIVLLEHDRVREDQNRTTISFALLTTRLYSLAFRLAASSQTLAHSEEHLPCFGFKRVTKLPTLQISARSPVRIARKRVAIQQLQEKDQGSSDRWRII